MSVLTALAAPRRGVPAYAYPETSPAYWDALSALPPKSIVIVNPESGPTDWMAAAYGCRVAELREAGVLVYGYVALGYGDRAAAALMDDVCAYRDAIEMDGVFLDQVPSDAAAIAAGLLTADACRGVGLRVAANPGQPNIPREAFDRFDEVVVFEGAYAAYLREECWTPVHGSARPWHLVYDVPVDRLDAVVRLAGARGADIAHASPLDLPNPWGDFGHVVDGQPW